MRSAEPGGEMRDGRRDAGANGAPGRDRDRSCCAGAGTGFAQRDAVERSRRRDRVAAPRHLSTGAGLAKPAEIDSMTTARDGNSGPARRVRAPNGCSVPASASRLKAATAALTESQGLGSRARRFGNAVGELASWRAGAASCLCEVKARASLYDAGRSSNRQESGRIHCGRQRLGSPRTPTEFAAATRIDDSW